MSISKEEYSVLAASAYNDARGEANQIDYTAAGWTRIDSVSDVDNPVSGLTVVAYQRGNDIVIACKGTDFLLDTDKIRTASDLAGR